MIKQMKMGLIALIGVVIWGFTPGVVHAAKAHDQACNVCHRSSASPRSMANLCVVCHMKSAPTQNPVARFDVGTASNTLGHNGQFGTDSGAETTHNWGGFSTKWAPAGSTYPPTSFYSSRYSISTRRVTCTICHDPHLEAGTKLVRAATAGDLICQQCHITWFISNTPDTNATLTHPVVADYAAIAAANPTKFNADPINVDSGDVRLVDGGVSCTSCHSTHYADSSSATSDGTTAYNEMTMAIGDGNILRSDGPLRTGDPRDTAVTGTAQLRSNLCQACHTYKMHGKGGNNQMIGCLDCHGGHGYNGGTPNAYVLASQSPDAVPVRANRAPNGTAAVDYPDFPNGGSTRTKWSDDTKGFATGLCETCHGDVQDDGPGGLGLIEVQHLAGALSECSTCHVHGDPGFSFANDANAATCGACHGFPPYKDISGYRATVGDANDGGYADTTVYNYSANSGHFKDETKTAHKTHAGAALPTNPGEWYFVGSSGIANCKVCHGDGAGTPAGNHQVAPGTDPNTFRNVPFNAVARAGTNLSPSFNTTDSKCYNVYCHTNGAPRTGDGPTRSYATVNTTPAWVGTGANYAGGGYGSIFLQAGSTRCADCHGNTAATMVTQNNSTRHQEHLGGGEMGITFGCDVCHVDTAASATALAAGATDGRTGGEHVNSIVDVAFKTSGSALYTSLGVNTNGVNYDATTGTCSVYCHDPADTGNTADWDGASNTQCDTCHGGTASDSAGNGGVGPITTGSHTRHFSDANGPQLTCAQCHGTNADAGSHGGHIDGVVTIVAPVDGINFTTICEECHGFDADPGEVLPVWGSPATTDCATCHVGTQCGADFNGHTVVTVDYARTSGHNRPAASGAYSQSGNPAANATCDDCHITDSPLHWDGANGDYLLRTDLGFPATYAGNENNFCSNCHSAAPSHPGAASVTTGINSHKGKLCVACHNIHGEQNIQMIWTSQADQVSHDPSVTGKYGADVFFSNVSDFTLGNLNSYDEDDGAVGGAGEANSDDLCATCHSTGAGTTHNEATNSTTHNGTGTHYQGGDCFTCHAAHTDSTDAFKLGAGTACNDCHGYPPNTGAHGNGTNKHARISSNDKDTEDRTDCAYCHTGADLYTYDLGLDQASVDPDRNNHAVSRANRQLVMQNNLNVGFNDNGTPTDSSDDTCTTACHVTSLSDGFWTDANGLNCNACHYYAASPVSGNNLSDTHDEHFAKGKNCSACHNMADSDYNGGFSHSAPLTHINSFDFGTGNDSNDGAALLDMAQATQDEAGYDEGAGARDVIPGMNYTDANTCSGGGGLGCHASGTPDWDLPIPATSAGCVMCHTNTDDAAYNPTSGLHDNNPGGPTVTGNSHDGSFDDGSAGTADCVTCHSASPTVLATNHINGTLNTGTNITVQAIAGYTQATGTCATTCHSAGTIWTYKWSNTAYNTDGTECANCHGTYATGWNTGVAPHSEIATRGNKHNSLGNLTYPCSDCHAIGSAGYKWISKWDPTGLNSNHGDDKITMNSVAGTNVFAIDTAPTPDRAGCTTTSCHNQVGSGGLAGDTTHTFPISTTAFTTQSVTGTAPAVSCSTCHGGYAGTNANGYWPNDGTNTISNASEDNSGAHLKHMTALAQSVYTETLAQLLTNNGNGTADAKQKFLCAYCHATPGSDGDHGVVANLPAEVNSMYALWDITRSTADNGFYNRDVDKTCATVDCHNNKTTPTAPTSYTWYSGSTSACIMCHVDITNGAVPSSNGGTHVAHTSAAASFGRTITCNDCHKTASETVAWGSPGTPPTNLHMNGSFTVTGTVPFNYTAGQGCATNACHNAGNGVTAPASGATSYPWGTSLANCTICHAAVPSVTAAHSVHLGNATLVPNSCDECHDAATLSTHIDAKVDFGGVVTAPFTNASYDGSCTNNCHVAGVGYWSGGPAALACADCHSGSYVGGNNWRTSGNNYLAQSGLHAMTATNVTPHNQTLAGGCIACHNSYASAPASHVDNVWQADGAANSESRFITLAGYSELAANSSTCSGVALTGCHSDKGNWSRLWSTDANSDYITTPATGQAVCNVCHGSYSTITNSTGWRAGTVHARAGGTKGAGHTDSNLECEDCHAYPGVTAKHEDGFITMSGDTNADTTTGEDFQLAWGTHVTNPGWYCASCHNGAAAEDALTGTTHTFVDSLAFPSPTKTPTHEKIRYADGASAPEGGCTGCHGNTGTGGYWPDGSKGGVRTAGTSGPADRPGMHAQHVKEIAKKISPFPANPSAAQMNATCNYCHPDPGGSGHNDASVPATMHDGSTTKFKRIVTPYDVDNNGVVSGLGTAYVTCNNIDCHFDMPRTPQWYTDDIAPAVVTLTAVPGPKPRSIKVSWTAPGDDSNVAATTPYVYDMRYSATSGTGTDAASDYTSTSNYAGNLPAAYKQGSLSEAIIENLDVGTTYYFSLKTRDVIGNWSNASAEASALPTVDTIAPEFGGADKATKGDEGGTINLYWTAAEDHTMPITYSIWMKDEAAGTLDMNQITDRILTGWTDTKIELNGSHGIVNDHIYHLGVRACDALGNCDTNTQTVSVTPTAPPTVNKSYHTYVTNGSTVLNKDGSAGTGVATQTLPQTFRGAANLTSSVIYYVDTFTVYITNTSATAASTVTATLGYDTTGSGFTAFSGTGLRAPLTKQVSVAKKSGRVYQFKFANTDGRQINNGERLAIQLSGATTNCSFGSTGFRGDVTVAERIVNLAPTAATNNGTALNGAIVTLNWNASTDIADGITTDSVHYDLYGSNNGGASYDYVIKEGLDGAVTTYLWDTQTAGITSGALAVRINAGDGYDHTTTTITGLGSATATDKVAPSAITDLTAKTRPKSGSVWLTWTAPGDDYGNHGKAKYYDIRYSTTPIVTEGDFAAIPLTGQATGEPTPDFGGHTQNFEVTGLLPNTAYNFAIKTYDEASNPSALSNVVTTNGGPRCGMCHTTAPSVTESVGNHKLHGFTINDCTKCHGAVVATYGLDHQDGELKMGFGPSGPVLGVISTTTVTNDTITYTEPVGSRTMYQDTNGYGGFGSGNYALVGDGTDNGNCFNWGNMGVGGCHGPAGAGAYATPNWTAAANLDCAQCHGDPNRFKDSTYNRQFDGTVAVAVDPQNPLQSEVPDQILGAPLVDNHGNSVNDGAAAVNRKYIGKHEKHLNYSFRFSKGDSCNLCHEGDYADRNALDGRHANGTVDVKLDTNAAGENALWNPGTPTTPGTCSNMSPESCHPSAAVPVWDSSSTNTFDCRQCHGMGGVTPTHVTDAPVNGWSDDGKGNCTWCHFGGHPRTDEGGTALILANSSQVGINYRSGGIHLRKTIGSRGPYNTEAELCWGCHDANGISEWGADNSIGGGAANNIAKTVPANASNYNYGQIYTSATYTTPTSNWTAGYWKSAVTNFDYKKGAIQSTHTTSETANAANANNGVAPVGSPLAGTAYSYTEAPDAVSLIRCSNCHDVHNLNKAPGDNPDADPALDGPPYLRGTWVRNPYPEDGAPWNKAYATVVATFGPVPRAGGNEQGGYQIDQNNNSPTAGLSAATSAGLCLLCHGSAGIDAMDRTVESNLWVGTNGHSNATLGGTGSAAANIFGNGIGGRAVPNAGSYDEVQNAGDLFDMALQTMIAGGKGLADYGTGYRGTQYNQGKIPGIYRTHAYMDYGWGATVDTGTTDVGYHAFTCSKCHNPHASRLPKLMITNCLDTKHSTWDTGANGANGQVLSYWTSPTDLGEKTSTWNTAQNCHRYDSNDSVGGWNKVTPW